MTTVKQVFENAVLPAPIYQHEPFVVLGPGGLVLFAGDRAEVMKLHEKYAGYYDDCVVEVRRHDLHLHDNAKVAAKVPDGTGTLVRLQGMIEHGWKVEMVSTLGGVSLRAERSESDEGHSDTLVGWVRFVELEARSLGGGLVLLVDAIESL